MKKTTRKIGRPEMTSGKRTKIIKARLTEEEFKTLLKIENQVGTTRMELIRQRVLYHSGSVLVNAQELLKLLDAIGEELGRSGNNINQLARHANVLNKQGMLNAEVASRFNELFTVYIQIQQEIEKAIRQIIRLMKT
ncbi:plasmid mobilization relaxosome protein MobC [Pedobacter gandavensis]|uniref:plasmid mobilization protein n=1 Tax=Pedobacter gandavensis TaxID=2679963 RepID=UPI002478A39A|nr:plasmid mobilization relaxosome protein MobC [Pedobacter gandavensis]WGQ08970.1 plasmid mobilization relaxosome protein MobC [Pedobacter gandavensis]